MTELDIKELEQRLAAKRKAIARIGDEYLKDVARKDIRYLEQQLIRARALYGMGED